VSDGVDVLFFNTVMRYYLHLDPDTLSDEEWAHTYKYLAEIRKAETKAKAEYDEFNKTQKIFSDFEKSLKKKQ